MSISNTNTKYLGIYSSATSSDTIRYANDYYKRAYEGLFSELIKLGCSPVLVFNQTDNYLGKGRFKQYWEIRLAQNKIKFIHRRQPIQINFLFDKHRFSADDIATSTPREIRKICSNKYLSYLFAPEWHAPSFLIENLEQLQILFKSRHDFIALKELDSNSGKKVFIGKPTNYDHSLNFPLIAQEFLDTSIGIDGICKGAHDLRTNIYNGKIISLLLRQPPKGQLKSNMAYGSSLVELDPTLVPSAITDIIKTIDARFSTSKDRFYSIDFCNTPDGWKIFELNAWPGLGYDSKNEQLFTQRLAKCLVNSIDNLLSKKPSERRKAT